MANIEQERDWMARMAEEARQREDAEAAQWRLMMEMQTPERCTCGHAAHEIDYGGNAIVLFWCRDESCLCGVEHCPSCGHYARHDDDPQAVLFLCGRCGHTWPIGAYA